MLNMYKCENIDHPFIRIYIKLLNKIFHLICKNNVKKNP